MKPAHSHWYAKIILTLLVLVLAALSVFLVRQYMTVSHRGAFFSGRMHFGNLVQHHTLAITDIGLIEPWMTFDYVSASFKVPTSYLAASLDMTVSSTPGYPNITLSHYARLAATSSDAVTVDVRSAVQDYLTPQATTTAGE